NGSLTWVRNAAGTHNLKIGGEIMYETLGVPFRGFEHSLQSVAVFNNNVPNQVRIYLAPSESLSGLWSRAAYVNDSWQVNRRLTVTAGLRWDRNRSFLPEQTGARGGGQAAAVKG